MARPQVDYLTGVKNTPEIFQSNQKFLSRYSEYDLSLAVDDIGTTPTTLIVDVMPKTLTEDLTLPSNLHVVWNAGCVMYAGVYTLTIEGDITAGHYQIFGYTSAVMLTNSNCKAAWFYGADLGEKINTANTSLLRGGGIEIPVGEHHVTTQMTLYGGRRLYSEGPAGNEDLNNETPAPVLIVYSGASPMLVLGTGSNSAGDNHLVEGITFCTSLTDPGAAQYTIDGIVCGNAVRKITITRCQFFYFRTAIDLSTTETSGQVSHVYENTFRRNFRCVYINGADHSEIAYNRMIDSVDAWVRVGPAGTYSVWLDHNNCANAGTAYGDGFIIERGTTVNITYNHLETPIAAPGSLCIRILSSVYCGMVNITGNFMNASSQDYIIELQGLVRGLNIQGNEFHGDSSIISAVKNDATLSNGSFTGNLLYQITGTALSDDTGFIAVESGKYSGTAPGLELLKFSVRVSPPDDPQDGQCVYADGTYWDPGAGAGLYCVEAGAYVKL